MMPTNPMRSYRIAHAGGNRYLKTCEPSRGGIGRRLKSASRTFTLTATINIA
jgi:hypothetical protein